MPTSRFVVIQAPLEEQLSTSLSAQLREAISLALRLKRHVNDTLTDDRFREKSSRAVFAMLEPGGLPFLLLVLFLVVVVVRELLLRLETKRILQVHQAHSLVLHVHDD